jgi:hypothetical protein
VLVGMLIAVAATAAAEEVEEVVGVAKAEALL